MARVTVLPSGKTVEAADGTTLLAAILAAEEVIAHKCEGQASCGTCHIFVQEGRRGLSKVARDENEKLDAVIGVGPRSRLACQAKLLGTENIKVELPSFGSGL